MTLILFIYSDCLNVVSKEIIVKEKVLNSFLVLTLANWEFRVLHDYR